MLQTQMPSWPGKATERREFCQLWTGECDNRYAVQPSVGMPGGGTSVATLSDLSLRRWKPRFACKNLSIFKNVGKQFESQLEDFF